MPHMGGLGLNIREVRSLQHRRLHQMKVIKRWCAGTGSASWFNHDLFRETPFTAWQRGCGQECSFITSLHNSALTAGSADLQRALTSQRATERDTRGTTVSEPR